jgi:hypothetical protein
MKAARILKPKYCSLSFSSWRDFSLVHLLRAFSTLQNKLKLQMLSAANFACPFILLTHVGKILFPPMYGSYCA